MHIYLWANFHDFILFWVNIAYNYDGIAIGYWASTYSYNVITMKLTTISEISHGYTALSYRTSSAKWVGFVVGVG